jgi:hypothetical protein
VAHALRMLCGSEADGNHPWFPPYGRTEVRPNPFRTDLSNPSSVDVCGKEESGYNELLIRMGDM